MANKKDILSEVDKAIARGNKREAAKRARKPLKPPSTKPIITSEKASGNPPRKNPKTPESKIGPGKRESNTRPLTSTPKPAPTAPTAVGKLKGVAKAVGRALGGAAKVVSGPGIIAAEVLAADDPSSDKKVVGTDFPKAWNKISALLKKHGDKRDIRELPKGIEIGTSSRILKEQLKSYAKHATGNLDSKYSKGITEIEASFTNALTASTGRQQREGKGTVIKAAEDRKDRNAWRSLSGKERRKYGSFEAYKTATTPDTTDLEAGAPRGASSPTGQGIGKAIRANVAAGADNVGVERAGQAGRDRVARRTSAETLGSAEGPRPKPKVPGKVGEPVMGQGAPVFKPASVKERVPSPQIGGDIEFESQKGRETARSGMSFPGEASLPKGPRRAVSVQRAKPPVPRAKPPVPSISRENVSDAQEFEGLTKTRLNAAITDAVDKQKLSERREEFTGKKEWRDPDKMKKRGTIIDPSLKQKRRGQYSAKRRDEDEWEEMTGMSGGQRKGGKITKKKATKAPAKKQYSTSHRARSKNPTINKTSYNY